MNNNPDSDDIGISITRKIIGTAFLIAGVAIGVMLLIAVTCNL